MFPDSLLIVQRLDLQGFLVRIVCLALERVSSCEWLLSYRMLLSNLVDQSKNDRRSNVLGATRTWVHGAWVHGT
jgi:hypothetical protein